MADNRPETISKIAPITADDVNVKGLFKLQKW